MVKHSKKAFLVIILFIVVFLSSAETITGQSSTTQSNTTTNFSISILNATYGNFDNQSTYNDIAIFFTLNCQAKQGSTEFDIYLTVTLPSGTTYGAAFAVITYIYPVPELVIYYYNIATEAGIYHVVLSSYMYGNGNPAFSQASIDFDPPTMGNGMPGYT